MSQGLIALVFAPFIGSFLGVLILRLPEGAPIAFARSACTACGARLSGWEMVPIVSFLLLRGRCRHCDTPIAPIHWQIEAAATVVAGVSWLVLPNGPVLWGGCVLGWGMLALAWIDARTLLLPDALTLPLLLAGLGWTAVWEMQALADHALAALMAWGGLLGIAAAYRVLRGRDGLGGGDAKLLGVAGAWLGLHGVPWVLAAGAGLTLLGAVAVARWRGISRTTMLPLGPGLSLAIWGAWLFGPGIR